MAGVRRNFVWAATRDRIQLNLLLMTAEELLIGVQPIPLFFKILNHEEGSLAIYPQGSSDMLAYL